MKINGRTVEATPGPGSYLAINRIWKNGDHVDLELPMHLTAEAMPDDPTLQSFLFGPILLAGDLGRRGLTEELIRHRQGPETSTAPMTTPKLNSVGKKLDDWIQRDGRTSLSFRVNTSGASISLEPFKLTSCGKVCDILESGRLRTEGKEERNHESPRIPSDGRCREPWIGEGTE